MKLIKDDILKTLDAEAKLRQHIAPKFRADEHYMALVMDCDVVREVCRRSQTIIFPTEVLLDLIANIDRIDLRGEIHLPYPYLVIQLSKPLSEKDVLPYPESLSQRVYDEKGNLVRQEPLGEIDDQVLCFCFGNPCEDPILLKDPMRSQFITSFSIWFSSLSVNRSAWKMNSRTGEPNLTFEKYLGRREIQIETEANKTRIMRIAYAIALFLNAQNVTMERVSVPTIVNAKRERKGKASLPDYHVVKIEKIVPIYKPSGKKGTQHSRMYPVRGHFRRVPGQDKPLWIPNHYRGLAHGFESLVKEVYTMNPKK